MKKRMYEVNNAASMFIPSNPALNDALQNTQVQNMDYNQVTIEDMRKSPELFNTRLSGYDKVADVQRVQRDLMPKVGELSQKLTQLKQIDDQQRGRFRK